MTEDEFNQSLVGQALDSFREYMDDLTGFVSQFRTSTGIVLGGLKAVARIANHLTSNENGELPDGQVNPPIFHALAIIGAWSALEAYVADFCRAVMREDRTLVESSEEIKKLKFSAKDLLFLSEEQKADTIYRKMQLAIRKGSGVEVFESLLGSLQLSGPVPGEIERTILSAQQIRNVWAHHAGKADAHFVQYASVLPFKRGEKVVISDDDTNKYIWTLLVYGLLITNRWRVKNGLPSFEVPHGTPFKDAFDGIPYIRPSD